MGKDWYWGGGKNSSTRKEDIVINRENPGCMSGVLNLFDFHQFQFPITQPPCFKPNSILQEEYPTFTKGVEAPRNSLEESEANMNMESSTLSRKLKKECFDIPMEIRVLATNAMKSDLSSSSDCSSSSPGPKTPSLVARLMGLDLLPDTHSSSSSSVTPIKNHREEGNNVRSRKLMQSRSNNNQQKKSRHKFVENELRCEITGSRSLPDTPRISSARRSDVEARFSLQINKENMMCKEELDYFSRISKEHQKTIRKKELRNEDQENRSPSHYARQIVKQVKETVSRRRSVGLDITNITTNNNTTANNNKLLHCNEVDVVLLKSKKPKRLTKIGEASNSNKLSTSSHSPRLRLREERVLSTQELQAVSISSRPLSKPRTPPPPPPQRIPENSNAAFKSKCSPKPKPKSQALPQHQTMEKCKKATCERFTQRKEVRGSKQHLSKEITNVIAPESCPSTSSSSSSQIQASKQSSRLSSCSSRTWSVTPPLNDRGDNNNDPTTSSPSSSYCFADEIRYVSEILKCTGINKDTLVSFTTRWFSPSHPLDPSIFPHLENFNLLANGPLKHRCNRRLVFNLIDELLANFIKPYLNMKPWLNNQHSFQKRVNGVELLECLCIEMKKFPSSNCQTLEDIDGLIEKDLPDEKMRTLPIFEESESIVFEIEQDILDSLVRETAADVIQNRRHSLCFN